MFPSRVIALGLAWCFLVRCISVWEGSSVVLPCGQPESNGDVKWTKKTTKGLELVLLKFTGGLPMVNQIWGDDVHIKGESSLVINPAGYPRDNGIFHCGQDIHLTVLCPVENISVTAPEKSVSVNTPVSFICEVSGGNPAPNITWYLREQNGSFVRAIQGHSTTLDLTDNKSISRFIITPTKEMNNKVVVCNAAVSNRSISDEVTFEVKYKPEVAIQLSPIVYSFGDDVTLMCSADGNPPPEIYWTFEGNIVSSETNTSLYAHSVSSYRGKFSGNQDILEIPVQWKEDGSAADPEQENKTPIANEISPAPVVSGFRNNNYDITRMDISDVGIYTCTANNSEGVTQKVIKVQARLTDFRDETKLYLILGVSLLGGTFVFVICTTLVCRCNHSSQGPQSWKAQITDTEEASSAPPHEGGEVIPETDRTGEQVSENNQQQEELDQNSLTFEETQFGESDDSYMDMRGVSNVSCRQRGNEGDTYETGDTDSYLHAVYKGDLDEIQLGLISRKYFISDLNITERRGCDLPVADPMVSSNIVQIDGNPYDRPFPRAPKRHTY